MHSTWWVIGKASNARSDSSRYPAEPRYATSLARAAGSHAT